MPRRSRKLPLAFFRQGAEAVAAGLLGKVLVHKRPDGRTLRGRIVETEAYLGPADLASHSSKGRTKRTEVIFGPAGRAYVYFIYGMHEMFNVVVGKTGDAEAVLLRAAEPLDGWQANLSGPGRLARAFEIDRGHNGLKVTGGELYFIDDGQLPARFERSKRIGVEYAKHWAEEPLRFYDAASRAVSGTRKKVM
jgi:DNA-3-methyladenine glycosylase